MRHLDLFSGIGGFALAARWMGWETVGFCEIDPYCQKVLRKHWPEVPVYEDVRDVTENRLRADGIIGACAGEAKNDGHPNSGGESTESVNAETSKLSGLVLTGGFPCQDISHAGKQAGIDGERSGLWSELARIIGEVRPRYAVLENVSALLSGDSGRWFQRVLGDLAEIGYDCEWHCIPASAIGAPHRRDRVWIIAYPMCRRNGQGETINQSTLDKKRNTETHREGWAPVTSQVRGNDYVADTEFQRPSRSWEYEQSEYPEKATLGQAIELVDGGIKGFWDAEPDVGRVVDGLSTELDLTRQIRKWHEQSGDKKTIPTRNEFVWRFLRAMWENRDIAEASPELYLRRICDSVPEVPLRDTQSRWLLGPWIEKDEGLRDMWQDFFTEPFKKAQDMQFRLLERARTKKRPKALEGSRTDRLRGLGNAIVPQVALMIFRSIQRMSK